MLSTRSRRDASNASAELLGRQQPRISHIPPFVASAGDEAADAYELSGNELDPWQRQVLQGAMGVRQDGRWSAFEVGLVLPRQNGKDEILLARELWGLFIGGERLLIHSAHKFDTAMEHMDRLVALIDAVPEFRKRLAPRQPNRSHGSEGIRLRHGQRIRFRARTKSGGGRGYTGDCVIFNETMELPDEIVGAIMPIMSARSMRIPGPQVWNAGSAVDQQTMANGLVLARIREAGIAGLNERMAYFEWSAALQEWLEDRGMRFDPQRPEVDQITSEFLADVEQQARANPAGGRRISFEHIEIERESPSMSARQFAIERLGVADWPDTSEDADRVISREAWEAVAEQDPANRITGTPIFAADAQPDLSWGAIAVSGKRDDGLFNGAVEAHQPGTDWIVPYCLELKAKHPRMRVVIQKTGPLGSHLDDFKRAKIRVIEANTEEYSRACVGMIAGVTEKRFRHPVNNLDQRLSEALAAARAKDADIVKWTRKDAEADISPFVAVTLAYWGAEQGKGASRIINLNDLD